jgi:hypothetical protein
MTSIKRRRVAHVCVCLGWTGMPFKGKRCLEPHTPSNHDSFNHRNPMTALSLTLLRTMTRSTTETP